MASNPIYLDHNSTTPVDPLVLESMLPFLQGTFGNASSLHLFGAAAKQGIDDAREIVARYLGCDTEEVIFTSGATESDNHVLRGVADAFKGKKNHIITSAIEHPAILTTAKLLKKAGCAVTFIRVSKDGVVDPEEVKAAINEKTMLISIMYANNEIGTLQPIVDIGRIAKEKGVLFHTDAVQAAGKVSVNVDELGVDFMSLSGHKIYGPKGTGVLYIRKKSKIQPLVTGGHHEFGKRAGTENVSGIVGFGRAFELAHQRMAVDNPRIAELRDYLQQRLLETIPHLYMTSMTAPRNSNTLHVLVHFIEGEGLLLKLSINHQIGISTGSACTSGSLEPSHVLEAMGISKQLGNSGIRLSLGRGNTKEEMDRTAEAMSKEIATLRSMSPLYDSFTRGRMSEADRNIYETWVTPQPK